MQVIEDAFNTSDLPRGGIATIGNYDGIHLGQRHTVERVVRRARERGVPAVVVTFEPHTLNVLRPESAPARLTTRGQKEAQLAALGVDAMAVIHFGQSFARTPAEEFVRRFLGDAMAVIEVHVGASFSFGHRRQGDAELLARLGAELGFAAHGVDEVAHEGRRISSTRIRSALLEGRVEAAMAMLGRPYAMVGTVARGDRMGQRLGWPTANLDPASELTPADGVYAGRLRFLDNPGDFACATNVGTRPTVYENYQRVVESHILDFASDIYGARIEVSFHQRLREERLFPSVMDLSSQVRRDIEATREYFAARERLHERAADD